MALENLQRKPTGPKATVDGRNPANHLGCIKPYEEWDNQQLI